MGSSGTEDEDLNHRQPIFVRRSSEEVPLLITPFCTGNSAKPLLYDAPVIISRTQTIGRLVWTSKSELSAV
jgi:hypothetical protein